MMGEQPRMSALLSQWVARSLHTAPHSDFLRSGAGRSCRHLRVPEPSSPGTAVLSERPGNRARHLWRNPVHALFFNLKMWCNNRCRGTAHRLPNFLIQRFRTGSMGNFVWYKLPDLTTALGRDAGSFSPAQWTEFNVNASRQRCCQLEWNKWSVALEMPSRVCSSDQLYPSLRRWEVFLTGLPGSARVRKNQGMTRH